MELLDQIDRAIDGLCPCGAEPQPGSAYCGDDCTPTHIAADTDSRETSRFATPMRWRPDLVTEVDESELTLIAGPFDHGPYTAHLYRRTNDPDMLHLRLDDGHRWVGCDVRDSDSGGVNPARMLSRWNALERELTDRRRLDPDPEADPWSDAWAADIRDTARRTSEALSVGIPEQIRAFQLRWLRYQTSAPINDPRAFRLPLSGA